MKERDAALQQHGTSFRVSEYIQFREIINWRTREIIQTLEIKRCAAHDGRQQGLYYTIYNKNYFLEETSLETYLVVLDS